MKDKKAMNCKSAYNKGFTLLEMAISFVIIALLAIPALAAYNVYQKRQAVAITDANVKMVSEAVATYASRFGHYPCPASLTAPAGAANYGSETDCADTVTVPSGTCAAGICVEDSVRTIAGTPPRVRRGAVPFVALGLEEKNAYDGYRSRLVYAVTERLAVLGSYNAAEGGLDLINGAGGSILNIPGSAHFALFSAGPDKVGGYNASGVQVSACGGAGLDLENCDTGGLASYRSTQSSTSGGAQNFDDAMTFYTSSDTPLWTVAPDPLEINDTIPPGGGFGIGTSTPTQKVDVNGNVRAQGNIHVTRVCNAAGTECFTPAKIGGSNLPGSDMVCAAGFYARGIDSDGDGGASEGGVECLPIERICPPEQHLISLTDGVAVCDFAPCPPNATRVGGSITCSCTAPYVWSNLGGTSAGTCVPPDCQAYAAWNYGTNACECSAPYVASGAICVPPPACTGVWNYLTSTCSCLAPLVWDGAACVMPVPVVNGACGPADGVPAAAAPGAGLCSVGTASAVAGAGPWTWSCVGSGGGTTAACSAPVMPVGPHGGRCSVTGARGPMVLCVSPSTGQLCSMIAAWGVWTISPAGCDFRNNTTCATSLFGVGVTFRTDALGISNLTSGYIADGTFRGWVDGSGTLQGFGFPTSGIPYGCL